MPPSQWSPEDYTAAYWFAAHAHQGQTMPGSELPYLIHISLVTMEVIAALVVEKGRDETLAVQCALLHDVIEDTPVTYEQVAAAFGAAVGAGVLALSKDPHLDKALQMPDSLRRIRRQPPEVWMVKLADRTVNLQQPRPGWPPERIRGYQAEGRDILAALEDASPALAARLRRTIDHYNDYLT
jgi:guanosine-3',5'-bis(diphosphate) 3'-pyrophosphohydrolase